MNFRRDLERLINKHSKENGSGTPDFILADFLINCLNAFDITVNRRREWYSSPKSNFLRDETIEKKIEREKKCEVINEVESRG